MTDLRVREERPADVAAIRTLVAAAFRDHPHSRQTEHRVIEALRSRHALVVGLVAESDGEVVGHVAFTRVGLPHARGEWYGLGPLAVTPGRQRSGIGRALVAQGLAELRRLGAAGCVVLGEPAYYGRFGFTPWPGLSLEEAPPAYILGLPFGRDKPAGPIEFHSAFFEAE
ncbi:MAG: N-acetyltransferase [Alsobacter sp.]